jgi:signal transduction histidine kinase/DNA-binding response OmpR family regulator
MNKLDNIDLGILEFDKKMKFLYKNIYIETNFTFFTNELSDFKEYIHIDDTNLFDLFLLDDKKNIKHDIRIKSEWFCIKRSFNKTYIYTFENINKFKLMEYQLEEQKMKNENNFNHKSLFLANINHELRTPMNGIIGMLTLLEDTILNNEQKDYIEMMRECSVSLMSIINDILDYSKLEAGKVNLNKECIDLRHTIDSTNDIILSKLHEKNLEYNYNIDNNINFKVKCDSSRIKQVLLNLLSNSIKFTDNGSIFLDIKLLPDNFIKFSIIDTGCGIEKYDQDKLFQSFSQLESQSSTKLYKGTGLGLAISKELVLLMGGNIWIEQSVVNKGSTFCFTIKTESCTGELINIDKNIEILRGKTIFVLDDKRENRISCANMLQKLGMIVTTYSDATEALYFLKTQTFNLGLVDCIMPYMPGPTFAAKLKEQLSNQKSQQIPLISCSSLGENYINNELFKGHLIKPIKENKLKSIMIDILMATQYTFKKDTTQSLPLQQLHSNYININIKQDIRILLVEDILINQKVVISFLNKMGFKNIDVADDGVKCLEKMSTTKYDLILLDIRMPSMDGTAVIKYIIDYYTTRKPVQYKLLNNRKPYIIAVTAYCLKEDKDKYIEMGFDDYIPKPININDLNKCINVCIENLLQN